MSLTIGIVGLPNVGKSTLFQALTKNQVDTSNYPFATIDPNVGVVAVPDERLDKLTTFSSSQETIPASVEFTDIAGLVKGAAKGEGLGNKFLSHIREVDAICHVVRSFQDENVTHVAGKVDPQSDEETIMFELAIADMEQVSRALNASEGKARSGDKEQAKLLELFSRIKEVLDAGKPARSLSLTEDELEIIKPFNLLTMKPVLTVLNVDEEDVEDKDGVLKISVKMEAELAGLSNDEAKEYLNETGWKHGGLERLIKASYNLLGLATYFTTGEKETRAWTFHQGALAPEAAGVIHTDFEEGFIRAEVVNWKVLLEHKNWNDAKDHGKIRMEGKDYAFQDGDVTVFHHA